MSINLIEYYKNYFMSKSLKKKLILISELFLFTGTLVFIISNNLSLTTAMGLLIIAILIPLFVLFPYYSLLLLIIVRNATDIYTESIFINFFNIIHLNFSSILGILIIVWAIYIFLKEKINLKKIPLSGAWFLFLGLSLISIFYSLNKMDSVRMFLKLLDFYFIYSLAYFYFTKYKSKKNYFLVAVMVAYILPVILGFYQIITKNGFIGPEGFNRIYGSFSHPNIFSFNLFFLFLILVLFYFKPLGKKFKKWNLLALIGVGILIIYTLTRSTWIATVILLICLMWIYYSKKIPLYLFILSLVIFVSFILVNYTSVKYFNWNNINIICRAISPNDYMSSWDWRISTWTQMTKYIYDSPLIGYGLDTYRFLREKQAYSPYETSYYAHNDYLKILIELGILGLLLYLNLIFQTLKKIFDQFQNTKEKRFLISGIGLLLIFLIGAVDNILMATSLQWMIWIYIAHLLSKE